MESCGLPSYSSFNSNMQRLEAHIARFSPEHQELAILYIAVTYGEADGCVLSSYSNGPLAQSGDSELLLFCGIKLFAKDKEDG